MGKINKIINGGGSAAWTRLAIYIIATLITVSVMYGRSDQKIAANAECLKRHERKFAVMQSIDRRLARIEGRLDIKGD